MHLTGLANGASFSDQSQSVVIIKKNQSKTRITFDTQVKTALKPHLVIEIVNQPFVFVSDEPETWRNKFQRSFDNQWKYLSDGCSCSRETWTFLGNAGFSSVCYEKFYLNELMLIAYLMRPHMVGYAVK